MKSLGQVLEWSSTLTIEEQESLISILQRRLREQQRAELVKAVKAAHKEFKAGRCQAASFREIMAEVCAAQKEAPGKTPNPVLAERERRRR